MLRGLKPDDFNAEESVIVFAGISAYVAARRGTNQETSVTLCKIVLLLL